MLQVPATMAFECSSGQSPFFGVYCGIRSMVASLRSDLDLDNSGWVLFCWGLISVVNFSANMNSFDLCCCPLRLASDALHFQMEFQPPQAIWLISIDFYGFLLLAFQNIQLICEVNGRLKRYEEGVDFDDLFT
ncbi:hypothetical protein AVEN_87515-1 [Araneus ventricosus]|uniref:Uncharacterized protein n=1 Tax=Araneus ventricosus TaxID=182803 RepID=A0A4Y2UQ78_ARAVE|nr:hypothetical protein AVEN_87515-1 [Araneus ventricosus]